MSEKLTVNVNELKKNMGFLSKIFFLPFELIIKIFNYIYIALLVAYFRFSLKSNIKIDRVSYNTDINIIFINKDSLLNDLVKNNISESEYSDDSDDGTDESDIKKE